MSDYEYVEINSKEDLESFIESATKEELILLKHDLEDAKKMFEDDDDETSGGRALTLKRKK